MTIHHLRPGAAHTSYNVHCQDYSLHLTNLPFQATQCSLPPLAEAQAHAHLEREIFIVTAGHGDILVEGERFRLSPNELIIVPSGHIHQLRNPSSIQDFQFLSIYDPAPHAVQAVVDQLLIAAPPTPNGALHLGHMSGPYLAMDIAARLARAAGRSVHTLTGTDDHQAYVGLQANQDGTSAQWTAGHFGTKILAGFDRFGIEVDSILRPAHERAYQNRIQSLFEELLSIGLVALIKTPTLINPSTQTLVQGPSVIGVCPHCLQEASGGMCENCFHHNEDLEILDPRDRSSGQALQVTQSEQYTLNLEPLMSRIISKWDSIKMPSFARADLERQIKSFKLTFVVSHKRCEAIPLPPAEIATDLRLNEWLEMVLGYVAMDQLRLVPRAKQRVQFFGRDNAFYYGIMHVGIYLALDRSDLIPSEFVVNQFLTLNGQKFSTSRRHAIWAGDLDEFASRDSQRAYLSSLYCNRVSNNFDLDDFRFFQQHTLSQFYAALFSAIRKFKTKSIYDNQNGDAFQFEQLFRKYSTYLNDLLGDSDFNPQGILPIAISFSKNTLENSPNAVEFLAGLKALLAFSGSVLLQLNELQEEINLGMNFDLFFLKMEGMLASSKSHRSTSTKKNPELRHDH